ncbi:hypothetical protein JCM19992_03790 [Thermostilla marina]
MPGRTVLFALITLSALSAGKTDAQSSIPDPRHIANGWEIPSEGYADQPYIVKTDDGAWLCVITTGKGAEGAAGQHIVSMRSLDHGKTWTDIVPIEPADGPEASYAVLLKVPSGRVYVFYNHNTDNVREVERIDGGVYRRVDSLGHYVFKYSDDHGRSWSSERYEVPIREFACDRENVYGGKLRFFWNVGRPLIAEGTMFLPHHKVGAMGPGFFARSEGVIITSRNILTERDPTKITFETLPEGDIGLRTPPGGGPIAEEQSLARLSDGSLFCVYRTIDGWPACAYSRDGGRRWTQPEYLTYTPNGRRMKHPRAANFVWNCSNGKFLYWFHNHGGRFIAELGLGGKNGRSPYDDRNPAWLCAGREIDTPDGKRIEWSQPEIVLYDDDPYIRMSYPDLVEEDGVFYLTETQKNIGRVHRIPQALVEGLFHQWENHEVARDGLLLEIPRGTPIPKQIPMPSLPRLNIRDAGRPDHGLRDLRGGFTFEVRFELDSPSAEQVLLDNRNEAGEGICLATTERGTIALTLHDGRQHVVWDTDPGTVRPGQEHHLTAIIDGGPKIILFVVDGILCDGGDARQFGWGRFSPTLRTPEGDATLRLGTGVRGLRIYGRALRVSEAVGNFQSGS